MTIVILISELLNIIIIFGSMAEMSFRDQGSRAEVDGCLL